MKTPKNPTKYLVLDLPLKTAKWPNGFSKMMQVTWCKVYNVLQYYVVTKVMEEQNIIESFSVLSMIKRTVSSSQPPFYMIHSILSQGSYEYITHSYLFRMST